MFSLRCLLKLGNSIRVGKFNFVAILKKTNIPAMTNEIPKINLNIKVEPTEIST